MHPLQQLFPHRGLSLKSKFPIKKEQTLKEIFPWRNRAGGTGSGFIDPTSRQIAVPVYAPPVPSFTVSYGSQTADFSLNTPPGIEAAYTGFGSFILSNTTADSTYTSLLWSVRSVQTNTYLLTGINQTYVILPDPNPTGIQTWEIVLTAYLNGTEGKSYMIISTSPASLNGNVFDSTTTVNVIEGTTYPLTFTNTSTGPFSSTVWTSTGVTLSGSGDTLRTASITAIPRQPPFTVTLTLYDAGGVMETITQTTTFSVTRLPVSLNGNTASYTTNQNILAYTTVPFVFTNTTLAFFTNVIWSSTNLTLSGSGSAPRTGSVTNTGFPTQAPFIVTLDVYDNTPPTTLVGSVTQTTNFTVLPNLNNSNFDIAGYRFGKKTNDGILTANIPTNGVTNFTFFPYAFYPPNFRDYSNTIGPRPFTSNSFEWTSSVTGFFSTAILGGQFTFSPSFPGAVTSNVFNIVHRTYDAVGTETGQSYIDVEFVKTPAPVVSLDGNLVNYSTTIVNAVPGTVIPFTFENTTTGGFTDAIWTSTGITLVGSGPITNRIRTASITVVANQPPFTVTLRIRSGFNEHGTVTRTTTFVASDPLNNQVTLTDAVALLDMTPQPQSNVSNYSGIHVKWIGSGVGLPAREPVNFKIQKLSAPISASFSHYQGNNAANALLTMSVDALLNGATSEQYTLGTTNQSIGESMSWNLNYLGAQTFTNQFVNQAAILQFNHADLTSRFFDSLSMSVRTGTTKVYTTAYQCYFSNSNGIATPTILANTSYFIPGEGRYVANTNGLASVTFQLPAGNRVVAVMSGGLLINNEVTGVYGHIHTSNYASLFNVTSRVSGNQITFKKVAGAQGSVMGFFIFNSL